MEIPSDPHTALGGPALPAPRAHPAGAIAALRRFTRPRPAEARCALCNRPLGADHRHLLDAPAGTISCACDACALRFEHADGPRFRLVPRRGHRLDDIHLDASLWDALNLPIGLVYLCYSTPAGGPVARYPGPAGLVEAALPLHAWERLVAENPPLADLMPDVEGVLVHRLDARTRGYRVPVDACYELAGRIRLHWRGLNGGTAVFREIDAFFGALT